MENDSLIAITQHVETEDYVKHAFLDSRGYSKYIHKQNIQQLCADSPCYY